MRTSLFVVLCFSFFLGLRAQQTATLDYYLPNIPYDPAIPTPASWLGYEVGEWHTSHDQLLGYMRALDAASNRISLQEYGRSYENRPLLCLTITAPENFSNLKRIQQERQQLANPDQSDKVDLKNAPAVYYMGYSIHGNETSGSHAALLVAYYLAAGKSAEIETLLKNTVILFDPCFNPDGMQRFSSWINSHKSKHNSPDPSGDEYNEPWPRGRTNHYGFDLNRDWLVAQQPESVGRVALFQQWRPNVLTDHHEMGSNATFFFQPGVASRVNPITPARNQELTAKIATYHARLLSEKQVLFYTGENFDDFYYGKGSTYPDAQGCIGILFEQASSRGTAQETDNGLLTFPYSIRNQVFASLSSLQAVSEMRQELNTYLKEFYRSAVQEAAKAEVKGYVFADGDLPARVFLELLGRHQIQAFNLTTDFKSGGATYSARNAFYIPCQQPQYRLIRAIFERPTQFQDSIFYDISAWTLPDAFGLQWSPVKDAGGLKFAEGLSLVSLRPPFLLGSGVSYAYAIAPTGYEFPKVLGKLLRTGLRVRVAMEPFTADGQSFQQGTLLIAADRQPVGAAEFMRILNEVASEGLPIMPIENGLTLDGPDLGSSQFPVVKTPKIVLLTGEGASVAESGEVWHQFDTRYNMPVTLVDNERFGSLNLQKYNVLILPEGNYGKLSVDKVKQFLQDGGTVVATGRALKWLKTAGVASIDFKQSAAAAAPPSKRPYASLTEDRGALAMPGAIFEAELDLTHPLCFGYTNPKLPVFFGDTLFVNPGKNPYATPLRLGKQPLLAGYVHARYQPLASNAAAALVYGIGRGRVIGFPGNPNFRAFWYGTNRLFANAVFFGHLISGESTERK